MFARESLVIRNTSKAAVVRMSSCSAFEMCSPILYSEYNDSSRTVSDLGDDYFDELRREITLTNPGENDLFGIRRSSWSSYSADCSSMNSSRRSPSSEDFFVFGIINRYGTRQFICQFDDRSRNSYSEYTISNVFYVFQREKMSSQNHLNFHIFPHCRQEKTIFGIENDDDSTLCWSSNVIFRINQTHHSTIHVARTTPYSE